MLSVAECAEQLGVSPARVRALIKSGLLPAVKNGREWVLREEDVLQRLMEAPRAGRPRADALGCGSASGRRRKLAGAQDAACDSAVDGASEEALRAQRAFDECRQLFGHVPSSDVMAAARSHEEASFYMAAFDFFLQQRQRELVKAGVF